MPLAHKPLSLGLQPNRAKPTLLLKRRFFSPLLRFMILYIMLHANFHRCINVHFDACVCCGGTVAHSLVLPNEFLCPLYCPALC